MINQTEVSLNKFEVLLQNEYCQRVQGLQAFFCV